VRSFFDARDRRILAMQSSRLVSNVFLAIIMFIVILAMGFALIREGRGWGKLIIYLVAMQHGLFTLRSVTGALTSINRFHPQLTRYREFLELSDRHRIPADEPLEQYRICAAEATIPGSLDQCVVRPGDRLLLLCPTEPNRYTVGFLLLTLLGGARKPLHAALHHLAFVAMRQTIAEDRPLREALGLPPQYQRSDLESLVAGTKLVEQLDEQLPPSFDEPMPAAAWQQVSRQLRYLLATLSVIEATDAQWVFIDDWRFGQLDEAVRRRLLKRMHERLVVLVGRDVSSETLDEPSAVIIASDGTVAGLGDRAWLARNREAIAQLIRLDGDEARGGADDEDESDLDDLVDG
jgi:hypothetical protein